MTTSSKDKQTERGTEALYSVWALTSRIRWLKMGNSRILQQEYRNVFTGQTEWRDVEIVTQDKAE